MVKQHHRSTGVKTGEDDEKLQVQDMELAFEPQPTPSPLSLLQENVVQRTESDNTGFRVNQKYNDLLSSVTTSNNDNN